MHGHDGLVLLHVSVDVVRHARQRNVPARRKQAHQEGQALEMHMHAFSGRCITHQLQAPHMQS
jgi:hypothetical protein